jgi:hypothetical protein
MTKARTDIELLKRICLGNEEAMDFLSQHWAPYVHAIDDIVDEEVDAEFKIKAFARAAYLYTHPFFLKHVSALRQVILQVTNSYADSVAWEKSEMPWQRQWADHHRHAGMEMVIAVAMIVGGYDHARAISLEQRTICYVEHHERSGKPI